MNDQNQSRADALTPCVHADDPKACYRVRCQLGGKCVDDDMSPRQPAAAPIDRAEMVKSWGEISSQMFAKMTPWQFYEAGWVAACATVPAPSPADERAATPACSLCGDSGYYVVDGPTSEADGHHPNLEPCDCKAELAAAADDLEPVDEVLEIVASYGPYGRDINEGLRFQIVLADEVKRLRSLHEFYVSGAQARAASASETGAEPVAWRYLTPTGWHATTKLDKALGASAHHDMEPLYAAPVPAMEAEPTACKGKNCGSLDPRFHSAECFEEYEKAAGLKPVQADARVGLTYQQVEALAAKHQFDMTSFDYVDSNSLVDLVNDALRSMGQPEPRAEVTVESLISIWSMRPQPGTPCGEAWEAGARQGWGWAIKHAARTGASS